MLFGSPSYSNGAARQPEMGHIGRGFAPGSHRGGPAMAVRHDRAAPATPEPAEMRIVRVSPRWASLHIDRRALPGQSHRENFHLVEPMLIGILDILSVQWNWDL